MTLVLRGRARLASVLARARSRSSSTRRPRTPAAGTARRGTARRGRSPAGSGSSASSSRSSIGSASRTRPACYPSPDSGPCDLETFDPDRTLDPSNADSPFFGYVAPGTPIRVRKVGATDVTAWTGYVDEATYDVAWVAAGIRCVDGIAYLAQADLAKGVTLPNTLRARVRAIVASVGLSTIVPVADEPPEDAPVDPRSRRIPATRRPRGRRSSTRPTTR